MASAIEQAGFEEIEVYILKIHNTTAPFLTPVVDILIPPPPVVLDISP